MRVAFFDVDGTLISDSTWDSFFLHERIGRMGKRRMYMRVLPIWLAKRAGIVPDASFRDQWVRAGAGLLKGWARADITDMIRWIVDEQFADGFRKDIAARVQQHKANGDHVTLVSGMFDEMVKRFAERLGADTGIGTRLAFDGDRCRGKIDGVACAGANKLVFIQQYLQANGIKADLKDCAAYADSYSDIPMLSAVGHPVATYPDEALRAHAQSHGWTILPAG